MDNDLEVRAVVFDFGGVVQRPAQTSRHALLAHQLHVDPRELAAQLPVAQAALKRGHIDEPTFWRQFAAQLGGRVDDDAELANALAAHYLAPGVCGEVLALAGRLGRLKIQTPLCSNSVASRAALNERRGAYAPFWPRLLSCEIGAVKPEPAMFAALLAQTGLEPAEHLLVDDKAENVDAAVRLGLRGHVYTRPQELIEHLQRLGIHV